MDDTISSLHPNPAARSTAPSNAAFGAVGTHRPVYFWAGPDTVRMNRLKFMDQPVNERVHLEAHTPRAARMLADAGFNWAYLMFNWGFPPEEDRAQRESFAQAVEVFHRAGIRVFGYVQLSNCVYAGSHRERAWYARDTRGRKIFYYTGRYMTCWHHPTWREHLRQRVRGVVEAGADGVFLDNPWMGLHILTIADTWVTGAGCACPRCRAAYARASGGQPIPRVLVPADPNTQRYLTWRADVVWDLIDELAVFARALRPEVVVTENVYDAVNRNHYADFGVDLRRAARISDAVMIEDHSFPRLVSEHMLVNNAITCKAARAWSGDTPVTTDPYIAGIGFDPVYAPRQFRQAVGEGAACGTATVVKGTEFFDLRDGGFTLLTGEPFEEQRRALGRIHRWLEANAGLYGGVHEASPLAVYFPYDTLPFDWRYAAPLTFAACQTLIVEGLPFRIVGPGSWEGVDVLVVPPGSGEGLGRRLRDFTARGGRVVALGERRGLGRSIWLRERPDPTFLERHPAVRGALGRVSMALFRAYFSSRLFRRLLDRANVTQRVIQGGGEGNPLFAVPPAEEREALLRAVGDLAIPRVVAEEPVLITWWRDAPGQILRRAQAGRSGGARDSFDGGAQELLHLVNYAPGPQNVTVELSWPVRARQLSPDREGLATLEGRALALRLDVYTVLACESGPRPAARGVGRQT